MDEMERSLLAQLTKLSIMNARMIVQIYELHHQFVEEDLPLLPPDPGRIRRLSFIEQLTAHLNEAAEGLEKMQRALDRPS